MATFKLKVITPDKIFFEGETEQIILRTTEGDIGILARHENFVGSLPSGPVRIKLDGKFKLAAISEGIVKVSKEQTVIIADAMEWSDEIDVERAKQSLESAKEKMLKNKSDEDFKRADLKLKRALNRLNVSSKSSEE